MDFLKKSISTIDNAIEINKLKDEREDLTKKRTKITDKLKKYDRQIELKNIVYSNIQSNENTIAGIKEHLFLDNVEITDKTTVEEFSLKYSDNSYFINLFQLYNNLLNSQKVLLATLNEIGSIINIDKTIYETKKVELDKQIETVNSKLNKVRTKQFK
jgi:prefoldin subunit 5